MKSTEEKKAEAERIFEEARQSHNEVMKWSRWGLFIGIFATIFSGSFGVFFAWQGKLLPAFIQFFLCLLDASLVRHNRERVKKHKKDWAELEAKYKLIMEHWGEISDQEMNTDC